MILCRSCGRVSTGSPVFCEGCGKSFNAAICPAKHENSPGASYCATCGSDELSKVTEGARLGVPNKAIAIVVGLILLKILLPFLPGLLGFLFHILGWLIQFVFGPLICLLWNWLFGWLLLWGLIGAVLQIISGEKINLYKVYIAVSKRLLDLLIAGLKIGVDVVVRLVLNRRKKE